MSDLNDFFAKKDRKKKRAAARSAQAAAAQSNRPVSGSGSGSIDTSATKNTLSTPVPKQPDDGWIEIEDPRGSQVNTGGRTVVEFRREAEDKEATGESNAHTEKFSGWVKTAAEEANESSENAAASSAQASSTAFPTLADAAKVRKVPPSYRKESGSSYASAPGRPRFINTNTEKLRQKLAERAASGAK